jgi:hypothetical protein
MLVPRLVFMPFALLAHSIPILADEPLRSIRVPAAVERTIDFRRDVWPILQRHCLSCHRGEDAGSGRRLDYRDAILGTDQDKPLAVSGQSAASRLVHVVAGVDPDLRMPPADKGEPLSDEQIAVLRAWIDQGLAWDETLLPAPTATGEHWAFQPVARPAVPRHPESSWGRSAIDAFVLARLRQHQLPAAAEADRQTLIRRLTFVLTGLPPRPDDIQQFMHDGDPQAYERLVDRLLASPQFGEHLARMWLDVVRYAETEGFEYDNYLPGLWRYRDYVIQSFNDDKPYDQFVREQLAGDGTNSGGHEPLIAAGFHRLGTVRRNAGNQNVASSRNEVLTEQTNIIGSALLGLTIGCARCHDHRFDPVPQADYYRLQAFFAAMYESNVAIVSHEEQAAWSAKTHGLNQQIERIKERLKEVDAPDEPPLFEQIKILESQLPPPLPTICSVADVPAKRTPIHILARGLPENPGEPVGMCLPALLGDLAVEELPADTAMPRRILADRIVDPRNPLTARVFVNRLWSFVMGQGIVSTPNDFGRNGDRPSHPELLAYLTCEFIDNGWRIKPLIREIVLSSTFRQSANSAHPALARQVDPDNRLLSRFRRKRLTAEELRDTMLAVAGRLRTKMAGPSVVVDVDSDLVELLYKPSQWQVTADRREHDRRSIYLLAKRNLRLPMLEVFDQPDLQTSCPRRESSTHALQALELLNGHLSNELAGSFAQRLHSEAGETPRTMIELAFWLALGRSPNEVERSAAEQFVREQPLREFTLAMFNLNGFIYVE